MFITACFVLFCVVLDQLDPVSNEDFVLRCFSVNPVQNDGGIGPESGGQWAKVFGYVCVHVSSKDRTLQFQSWNGGLFCAFHSCFGHHEVYIGTGPILIWAGLIGHSSDSLRHRRCLWP